MLLLVPMRWLRLLLVRSRIGGSLFISLLLLSFVFTVGLRRSLDRYASSAFKVVEDIWEGHLQGGDEDLFLLILSWLFGRHLTGIVLMSSAMSGVLVLRLVLFNPINGRVVQFLLVCRRAVGEVPCRSGGVNSGAGLLERVRVMRLMCRRLSILSTSPLLLCCFC